MILRIFACVPADLLVCRQRVFRELSASFRFLDLSQELVRMARHGERSKSIKDLDRGLDLNCNNIPLRRNLIDPLDRRTLPSGHLVSGSPAAS